MDHGHQLLHRAYTLVEAGIPAGDAIEDLITLAGGDVGRLEAARRRADGAGMHQPDAEALELIGYDPGLAQVARSRRAALDDLLDRAIASFG